MMLNFKDSSRINLAALDRHVYMSDLVHLDGPILSLFRDTKENWLYLWCDTDLDAKERWMLFPVSRPSLLAYLQKKLPLRTLVLQAQSRWLLDYTRNALHSDEEHAKDATKTFSRVLREVEDTELLQSYLPSEKSFFDETLAPNISVAQELSPTCYNVPIDGNWFIRDLDNFSNVYSQLYAFFYCTKPQFMTDIGSRVHRFLESPWKGGYSRVNLFEALQKMVPAIHDLKITQMKYASPGDITIEALSSVGMSVQQTVMNFIKDEKTVLDAAKVINTILGAASLKRTDLSKISDEKLPLTDKDKGVLSEKMAIVAFLLKIPDELGDLSSRSPNVIVSAKVLLAVVSRIERLAEFQTTGLLDLARPATDISETEVDDLV